MRGRFRRPQSIKEHMSKVRCFFQKKGTQFLEIIGPNLYQPGIFADSPHGLGNAFITIHLYIKFPEKKAK